MIIRVDGRAINNAPQGREQSDILEILSTELLAVLIHEYLNDYYSVLCLNLFFTSAEPEYTFIIFPSIPSYLFVIGLSM